jgi:replication initiation and membrane attachment protein DnaB
MEVEEYKKTVFQLDELIRHLLVDSNDIKAGRLNNWMKWWSKIEEENKDIYDRIYKQ